MLRKCIVSLEMPVVKGALGQPPFEQPSISEAVTNFMAHKFSHLPQQEWKKMYELAKTFVNCLNTWDFPSPSSQKHMVSQEEANIYTIAYTR